MKRYIYYPVGELGILDSSFVNLHERLVLTVSAFHIESRVGHTNLRTCLVPYNQYIFSMYSTQTLPLILLLFLHSCPTLQVDIRLAWFHNHMRVVNKKDPMSAVCLNILPGECCKPHERVILPAPETLDDYSTSHVSFTGLLAQQMGAGWAATTNRYDGIACADTPLVRFFGPTDGEEAQQDHPDGRLPAPNTMVFAASWIDLRTRFPPNSKATRYLQWQGVKRMAWGSNTWSASSNGVPFPKREKKERLNGWAQKGQVTVATPTRWRYPDVYEVNGTGYRDGGNGVFTSGDGRVLNLTSGAVG